MKLKKFVYLLCIVLSFGLSKPFGFAQNAAGALRGQVADPSGAAIPDADVILTPATGSPVVIKSNAQGAYEFKTIAAGKYVLTVAAPGFSLRK